MTLAQKAAYIQGLADGVELDETTKEGKLIAALLDLVGDMADAIEQLDEDLDTLNDYVEELDEDLGSVEELLYDDECDCCDDDDFECDGNCCDCDEDCELADEDFFEVECPACGEVICFDGSIDPEELACPACGEKFECIIAEEDLKDLDGE
ncbi:MAG: hypothetical protein E7642_00230 [Ruminococcaceae bacterium]|nr:hypothetical protein [Oscillospiraceae bacterium]